MLSLITISSPAQDSISTSNGELKQSYIVIISVSAGAMSLALLVVIIVLVNRSRKRTNGAMAVERKDVNSIYGMYHRGWDGEGDYGDGDQMEIRDTNDYYGT
jgi:hypothetical protein